MKEQHYDENLKGFSYYENSCNAPSNKFNIDKGINRILSNMIEDVEVCNKKHGWRLRRIRFKIFNNIKFSSKERNTLYLIIKKWWGVSEMHQVLAKYLKSKHKEIFGV